MSDKLNGKFGVFIYKVNEVEDVFEEDSSGWYLHVENAFIHALRLLETELMSDRYIEIWERDEEGLFGNSGVPIWASKHSGFYEEHECIKCNN